MREPAEEEGVKGVLRTRRLSLGEKFGYAVFIAAFIVIPFIFFIFCFYFAIAFFHIDWRLHSMLFLAGGLLNLALFIKFVTEFIKSVPELRNQSDIYVIMKEDRISAPIYHTLKETSYYKPSGISYYMVHYKSETLERVELILRDENRVEYHYKATTDSLETVVEFLDEHGVERKDA